MLTTLMGLPTLSQNKPEGWQSLVDLYYKIEVTNYCSLTTETVIAGFNIANGRLLKQYNFNQKQLNAIRGEAWAAGYREWDNRGLGGFRGWCKKEGQQYAREFIEFSK